MQAKAPVQMALLMLTASSGVIAAEPVTDLLAPENRIDLDMRWFTALQAVTARFKRTEKHWPCYQLVAHPAGESLEVSFLPQRRLVVGADDPPVAVVHGSSACSGISGVTYVTDVDGKILSETFSR